MFVLEVVLLLFWHASGTASEGQLGIRDGWLDDAVWCNFASSVFRVCGLVLSDEGSSMLQGTCVQLKWSRMMNQN